MDAEGGISLTCIICMQGGNIIKTSCCGQVVHKKCITRWLASIIGAGRCMHCRRTIFAELGSAMSAYESWDNPIGTIFLNTARREWRAESRDGTSVPVCHILEMSQLTEELLMGTDPIFLFEDGVFVDALNVPAGWVVSIDGDDNFLQLSQTLRADLTTL